MKVCLLNDSFPPVIDGVANVVYNYAECLVRQNTETIVGTPFYPDTDYTSYPYPVIAYPSLDTTALTSGYRAGYPFPIKEIAKLAEFEPDIIHAHCPINSCFIARSLRDLTDAPVILTYHTKYDIDIRKAMGDNLLADESIKALVHNVSSCDEVWAVSNGAGENLRSLGYEGNWKVVLNGVDFPKGKVIGPEADELLSKYDLPADIPVFLFVGRIMNYKGLPLIAESLRKLSEQGYDYRMMIVGQGADAPALQKQIIESGLALDVYDKNEKVCYNSGSSLPGKIIMTGPISDRTQLRMVNSRCGLFIFPSTFDTNGLVVREAAACGLASVLIKGSCAAEGITDGRNGFLCEENSASLASVLMRACENPAMVKTAGERAMQEIYLSWDDAVHTARGLYQDLLDRRKSGKLPRPVLGDDSLFTMTADAVRQYMYMTKVELPVYEGMMDNFIARRSAIREDIEKNIRDLFDL